MLCFFCFIVCPARSSTTPISPISPVKKTYSDDVLLKKISSLKVKDLEKLAGRKFTLKEKIALLILKKKLKHQDDANSSQGKTALTVGIVGAGLLIIGLFVPYVILGSLVAAIVAIVMGSSAAKKDQNDRKAHSAKLLGWITLGLIAFLILLAAVVIASWGF